MIQNSSTAGIKAATITGNQNHGVAVTMGSSAAVEGNVIQGNGGDGVRVTRNSAVSLDANVTGTEEANGGFGLFCSDNSSGNGSLDDLNGDQGPSQSETGCVLDL